MLGLAALLASAPFYYRFRLPVAHGHWPIDGHKHVELPRLPN